MNEIVPQHVFDTMRAKIFKIFQPKYVYNYDINSLYGHVIIPYVGP